MKIYISGPMTGIPKNNYPEFERVKNIIGEKAVSPHDIHEGETDLSWGGYMKRDIKALMDCDPIVMLDGWRNSRGAALELHIAFKLGYTIYYSLDKYLYGKLLKENS